MQLFKLLLVGPTGMSTADHDVCIWKVVCHWLRGRQVGVLPLNGNAFVLGFLNVKRAGNPSEVLW